MNNKYLKKTKIVGTLGPACGDKETILKMVQCGLNVVRINFSHADYEDVKQRIKYVREINEEYGFAIAILADLQGPKLRVGVVKEGSKLEPGDILTFTNDKCEGDSTRVYMTYQNFPNDVKVGERILIDDGKLVLEVVSTDNDKEVKAKVIQGGPLKSKKGVNLPNTNVSLPALTEKDIEDATFAIEQGVDWIALSFVRHADDIKSLISLIQEKSNKKIPIIAKIEKPEGVKNIDEILDYADGLMVARGDLGVEVPYEDVPLIQKKLVDKAKIRRKPVIIATQMMETMITSMTPTRAEVNDVANSVLDGADAVMLSGETSVGQYPVEVIKTMTKIIQKVEDDPHINIPEHKPSCLNDRYITDIICYNATKIATQIEATAIITLTHTGYTAFQISSHRPNAYIVVYTENRDIIPMLNLLWGVKAFYYEAKDSSDETVIDVNLNTVNEKLVNWGDFVINLNAMPENENGKTNTLRITTI
ncbi:MAG: pyruvate kinase [Flavobacteriales bacterium]|nr:pyruvate kinase [Flavobacteriales bacterium]